MERTCIGGGCGVSQPWLNSQRGGRHSSFRLSRRLSVGGCCAQFRSRATNSTPSAFLTQSDRPVREAAFQGRRTRFNAWRSGWTSSAQGVMRLQSVATRTGPRVWARVRAAATSRSGNDYHTRSTPYPDAVERSGIFASPTFPASPNPRPGAARQVRGSLARLAIDSSARLAAASRTTARSPSEMSAVTLLRCVRRSSL